MSSAFTPFRAIGVLALLLSSTATAAQQGAPFFPPFGIDLTARDPGTRPQDDFFQYMNGNWIARTVMPGDESTVNIFHELADRQKVVLHELLESAAAATPGQPMSLEDRVGAMYAAFMDTRRVETLGASPIQAPLSAVRRTADRTALARGMGESLYGFGGSIFSIYIDVDLKDSNHYAVYLNQNGLGMPDRDYYLKPEFARQRQAYRQYVQRLLTLVHWPNPPASARSIVAFETRIAEASWTKVEQRDTRKMYNPCTPAELARAAPGFPWQAFLEGAKLPTKTRVVVGEQTAFPRIAAIYAHTPLGVLRAWSAFNIVDGAAPYLSSPFVQARFVFRNKVLSGEVELEPRWKRALTAVAGGDCLGNVATCFGTLDWAVGQVYAAHNFTAETKARVQQLVANVTAAFRARVQRLDWMGEATRQQALKKLDTYTVKVGFPDQARDYSAVQVSRDDLVGDVRRAAEADWDFQVRRSEGPVDRSDWSMTPQTVDAYNGSLRDIVFPAAILQPPDFDPAADDAVNYGMIGVVIGHELTHGFDDAGRTLDAQGELRDWWSPADAEAFQARATKLGAQYAEFEPLPGLHINPGLTMGENIADLGGLVIALEAYHASLYGAEAPVIGGYTGDQRFFMAVGQLWRVKMRDDAIRQLTTSDPHSFRKFRALGPLSNVDEWYKAFDVKPGDRMYRAPADRVQIW